MRPVFNSVATRIAFVLWVLICMEACLQVFYYLTAHQTLFTRTAIPIFTPNEYCGFFNKPSGTFRALLLGSSFAFGWGVNYEDTAAAKIEGLLRRYFKGKPAIEVINAGVPSLAPLPQLNWFEHVGCSYRP